MKISVHLTPPLNNTAGQSRVELEVHCGAILQDIIDALVEQFGPQLRNHLYDDRGRIIPAWSVFVNGLPVQLNRRENLFNTYLHEGDELYFLLNIAGG